MSYDLQFYSKTGDGLKIPSSSEFNKYFNQHFPQISGEDEDWEYNNEETGTTFEITYFDPDDEWEDAISFEGFQDVGLTVSIELGVKEEHGKEFCFFAEKLQNHFGFYMMDSQINEASPDKYTADAIFSKWKEDNDWLNGINKIESNL